MQALDFIATARLLAGHPSRGRPLETNLRRAISTAYYALFHCLAECCADMIVGGPGANRNRAAWLRVYRALQHGTARDRCLERNAIANFSAELRGFAQVFADMQPLRNSADYDPDAEFSRNAVIQYINESENAIRLFPNASITDRRAFAVHVLVSARRN